MLRYFNYRRENLENRTILNCLTTLTQQFLSFHNFSAFGVQCRYKIVKQQNHSQQVRKEISKSAIRRRNWRNEEELTLWFNSH